MKSMTKITSISAAIAMILTSSASWAGNGTPPGGNGVPNAQNLPPEGLMQGHQGSDGMVRSSGRGPGREQGQGRGLGRGKRPCQGRGSGLGRGQGMGAGPMSDSERPCVDPTTMLAQYYTPRYLNMQAYQSIINSPREFGYGYDDDP